MLPDNQMTTNEIAANSFPPPCIYHALWAIVTNQTHPINSEGRFKKETGTCTLDHSTRLHLQIEISDDWNCLFRKKLLL